MKRIITFILAAITGASILFAQKDQEWSQARREIHENILMTGSNFKSYMEPTEKPTRSPKGYEPFYISTYARHGSRWLCSDSEYTDAMGILERAHEKNKPPGANVLPNIPKNCWNVSHRNTIQPIVHNTNTINIEAYFEEISLIFPTFPCSLPFREGLGVGF